MNKADVPTSYAARTMKWSGPIIAAFVIFHVLHLTTGDIVPLQAAPADSPDAYDNVIMGFQHPAIAIFYIIAVLLLCMHLYHGLWSMLQSARHQSSALHSAAQEIRGGIFAMVHRHGLHFDSDRRDGL